MAATSEIYGNVDLFRFPGKVYAVAQNGLATYDVSYWTQLNEGQQLPFVQGDAPLEGEYPDLVLLTFKFVTDGSICGGVRIDLHYEGIADKKYLKQEVSDDVTIQYDQNQDPIDSHPDFTLFAGTPDAPLSGAKFFVSGDNAGKFNFFQYIDPDHPTVIPNPFAGITSYICPTPSGDLNRMEENWPDNSELISIGKIIEPSTFTNNFPTLPAGTNDQNRNWLYATYRGRNIANTYFETQRHFLGSGPRPINISIYGNPPTFPT